MPVWHDSGKGRAAQGPELFFSFSFLIIFHRPTFGTSMGVAMTVVFVAERAGPPRCYPARLLKDRFSRFSEQRDRVEVGVVAVCCYRSRLLFEHRPRL